MRNEVSSRYDKLALWLFVLVPLIVVVTTEAVKTHLIWRMRIVDFADLVITAPYFLIMMLYFNNSIFSGQKDRKLYQVSLGLMVLTFYGHAMHLTGNSINTYSTEINHYLNRIPSDTYELIYFFDEDLGHWLLYTGLIGSLGIWMLADQKRQPSSWHDFISGGLLGVSYAVAIIESSQAWLGFVAVFWLYSCGLYGSRCRGSSLSQGVRSRFANSLWTRFGFSTALLLLIGQILYWLIFGGFIQPSQMGL